MITHPLFWAAYSVAAVLVGVAGRDRRVGFLGFFIFALLLTPAVVLLVLIVTRPRLERNHLGER
jgi:hypothetical protein